MDLKTAARGAPWMTREERLATRRLLRRFRPMLDARHVPESPFLALRLADLAAAMAIAARMQSALAPPPPTEEDPCPLPPVPAPALADALGKAQDRLRKAMDELEDHIDKYGSTFGGGLADFLKPLIEEADPEEIAVPDFPADPDDPGAPVDPGNVRVLRPPWAQPPAPEPEADDPAETEALPPNPFVDPSELPLHAGDILLATRDAPMAPPRSLPEALLPRPRDHPVA